MPTTYLSQYSARATTTSTKTKSIAYNSGTSDQIFSAASTISASAPSGLLPNTITVLNNGLVPLIVMSGYETYTDETSGAGATRYLHTMLMPGETYYPSVRAVMQVNAGTTQFDGTAVDNATPDSDMWTDSTADVYSTTLDNTTDPVNFGVRVGSSSNSKHIRVGDLIRIEDEIMKVLGTYEDDPTSSSLVEGDIRCQRGVYGSTNAEHSGTPDIRLPFFNAYHDFDKFSTARTTSGGRFKANNFFGVGRAGTEVQGIVPGSVAIKFYEEGAYQSLGLSGIVDATHSGLTASGVYHWRLNCDGAGEVEMNFTADSSNLAFGGLHGIIQKFQENLDEQFYTAGNLLEKKVTVAIVNGDLRFTSNQNLSTSSIDISAGDGAGAGTVRLMQAAVGRIPAEANVSAAVPASLPDDVTYDKVTYAKTPTSRFLYDDGFGKLKGNGSGTINYETGAIDFTSIPNAEFVYSVSHTSAFSGKLNDVTATRINTIKEILVNNPSQKRLGSVKVTTT